MLFKSNKPELSANFKSDYVALTAVLTFVFIVLAEVSLAVAIPSYLHREKSMARQVRRLKFFDEFDWTRRQAAGARLTDPTATLEMRLLLWNMNEMGDYLAVNSRRLTDDEVVELHTSVKEMNFLVRQLCEKKVYSVANELNTDRYIDSLVQLEEKK